MKRPPRSGAALFVAGRGRLIVLGVAAACGLGGSWPAESANRDALAISSAPADPGTASTSARGLPVLRNPDYVGRLIGQPGGRIALKLVRGEAGERFIVGQPRNISRVCEDETRRLPLGGRFAGKLKGGRFRWLYNTEWADSHQPWEFDLAKGRLLPHRRVKGMLFNMIELHDEPGGTQTADECWSDGIVRWRAHAVGKPPALRPAPPGQSAALRPETPNASALKPGLYEGRVPGGDPFSGGRVRIEVERRHHRTWIDFKTRLYLDCDAPSRVRALGPFRFRLARDGRLDRAFFRQHRGSKHRFFTWIRGRVLGREQVRGVLVHFDDPWDPEGRANLPECGADDSWTARRVR